MTVAKWSMSFVSLRGHGLIPTTREDVVSQELVEKKIVETLEIGSDKTKTTAVNNASRKSTQAWRL